MTGTKPPYDAVISLGSNCVVAHQMELFFGSKTQSCFDWLVTPFNSIELVLADDGRRFGDDIMPASRGTSVKCQHYGVLYHHEFERGPNGRVIWSKVDADKAKTKSKLQHKYRLMLETARNNRTLFIRYAAATDAPGDPHASKPLTAKDMIRLEKTLEDKIGHGDFHIVLFEVIGNPDERIDLGDFTSPRLSLLQAPFTPNGALGDPQVFAAFWRDFGFSRNQPPWQNTSAAKAVMRS